MKVFIMKSSSFIASVLNPLFPLLTDCLGLKMAFAHRRLSAVGAPDGKKNKQQWQSVRVAAALKLHIYLKISSNFLLSDPTLMWLTPPCGETLFSGAPSTAFRA